MTLPSASAYMMGVQAPAASFRLPELRRRTAALGGMGTPRSWSGAFATIFRMERAGAPALALRCFTQSVPDLQERYRAFEAFRNTCQPALASSLLETQFVEEGIQVGGVWYPVILMPWCEGDTLEVWVQSRSRDIGQLRSLQSALRALAAISEQADFVHGDLQHRNILVRAGRPVLVDYDNVFPPKCPDLPRTTAGLPSFQHPATKPTTPPKAADRFAYLILHTALEILVHAPELLASRAEVEGLLFQSSDLKDPARSPLFQAMREKSALPGFAAALEGVLKAPAHLTPSLETYLKRVGKKAPAQPTPTFGPKEVQALEQLYGQGSSRPAPAMPVMPPLPRPLEEVPVPPAPAVPPLPPPARRAWRGPLLKGLSAAAVLAFTVGFLPWGSVTSGLSNGLSRAQAFLAHPTRSGRVASIRADLVQRKEMAVATIVALDARLQNLASTPDAIAIQGIRGETKTAGELRAEWSEARAAARETMIQCRAILAEFDAALKATPDSMPALQARLAGIQGLPEETRLRILREL